jgi:nickel-type superoxide dismutase maturation protease
MAAMMTVLVVALLIAGERLAIPWTVAGVSMAPVLLPGDRVLVDRWTYRHRPPRAGEVVLLLGPSDVPMVKRVARVESRGGQVWVVGDNAADSVDSRRFGGLPAARIQGRVVCRYWPLDRAGPVRRRAPATFF